MRCVCLFSWNENQITVDCAASIRLYKYICITVFMQCVKLWTNIHNPFQESAIIIFDKNFVLLPFNLLCSWKRGREMWCGGGTWKAVCFVHHCNVCLRIICKWDLLKKKKKRCCIFGVIPEFDMRATMSFKYDWGGRAEADGFSVLVTHIN